MHRTLLALALVCAASSAHALRWRQFAVAGPEARRGAALTWRGGTTGPGLVLTGGCRAAHCDFGDEPQQIATAAFRLDGDSWTALVESGGPPPRWAHAAASAPNAFILVFGGWGDDQPFWLSDTWYLHMTGWVNAAASGPAARAYARAAFDEDAGRVVLYGGSVNNSDSQEIWAWDGSAWAELSSTGDVAPGRFGHAFAYDQARREFFVFGGHNLADSEGAWTFTCDYAHFECTWTRHARGAGSLPAVVDEPSAAYFAELQRVVLFGGRTFSGTYPTETWGWDGTTFSKLALTSSPSGRSGAAIAYDVNHARLVLFGGGAGAPKSDTWELIDDATSTDGGTEPVPDAGRPDAGRADAGPDAGRPDAGLPDPDPDAGTEPDPVADAGDEPRPDDDGRAEIVSRYGCATAPAGPALVIALVAWRRRRVRA